MLKENEKYTKVLERAQQEAVRLAESKQSKESNLFFFKGIL